MNSELKNRIIVMNLTKIVDNHISYYDVNDELILRVMYLSTIFLR